MQYYQSKEEDMPLNVCEVCGNQFRRYIGKACTMTCYYKVNVP